PTGVETELVGEPLHQERRPDPQEAAGERRGRLADGSPSHAPDEDRGHRREHDGYEPEREPARAEEGEQRRREDRLLRSPEALTPEERRPLAVQKMQSHEPDDRLVAVRDPEGGAVHPDPKGDTREQHYRKQDEPAGRDRTAALDQAARLGNRDLHARHRNARAVRRSGRRGGDRSGHRMP